MGGETEIGCGWYRYYVYVLDYEQLGVGMTMRSMLRLAGGVALGCGI